MMRRLLMISALGLIAACADANGANSGTDAAAMTTAEQALPAVLVYKTATCGCCNGWVEHMREAGYTVDARDVRDLMTVKRDAGVPVQMSSCHTSLVDGYVVEGHVPAEQIARLLAERPEIVGIAAPGMPMGSPGMEGPTAQPYQIYSFDANGNADVFAEIDPR
jgi:hypothetical protein